MVSLAYKADPLLHIWKRGVKRKAVKVCEANLVVDEAGEVATVSTELGIEELIALIPRNRVDKLHRKKKTN